MTREIKAAVFDIDGTLAMMDKATKTYTPLPGAARAIKACRDAGIRPIAYTNGTFFPPAHYYQPMADVGLVFEEGEIWTPAVVAANYLKAQGVSRVMALAQEGTTQPLLDAGIEVLGLEPTADVDAIMLGWCKDFKASEVEALCVQIWRHDTPVYATSVAPFFAGAKGRLMGMSGSMAAMIQNATGKDATVLGKPSTIGLDMIAEFTGVSPESMAVVGDDPKLEIAMARRGGSLAIGVTTGVKSRDEFMAMDEDIRAHIVVDTLEGFINIPELGQK